MASAGHEGHELCIENEAVQNRCSVMGALGCGELLMQLVLEEMEAAHAFDYAVVQATESSAGFYDKMGFVRVGAIAKYIKPGHTFKNA